MFCPKCGKEVPENARFCPNCGAEVNNGAEKVDSEVVNGDVHPYVNDGSKDSTNGNRGTKNSNSYTFALLGFILAFFVPIAGVVFSAIALSKLSKENNDKGKNLAIAGLVISIVMMVVYALSSRFINWNWNVTKTVN